MDGIAQKVWVTFHKEGSESNEQEKIINNLAALAVLFVNSQYQLTYISPDLLSNY